MQVFQNYPQYSAALKAGPLPLGAGYRCADCNQTITLPRTCGGAGYSIGADKCAMRCYPCTDTRERAHMLQSNIFTCYLGSDGASLTTWTGGKLARVVSESISRTGWHRSDITHVRAIGPDGAEWWGKGAGRGMVLTVRKCKGA